MNRIATVTLLIELAEKMGLLAAAALVAAAIPPLRNRLLGVGQRRDKLAAVALGVGLAATQENRYPFSAEDSSRWLLGPPTHRPSMVPTRRRGSDAMCACRTSAK